MNTRKLLTLAAVTSALSVFALGASAEEYEGVLQFHSSASRAAVSSQAVAAAHSPDAYAEGATAGAPTVFASAVDRSTVRNEAVAMARAGNVYGDGDGAFGGNTPRSAGGAFARINVRRAAY